MGIYAQQFDAEPNGLIDWIDLHGAFWCNRFDALETLLNRKDQ